jgi:RNA polymerase sigma factor (TIGR02999 family)
MTEKKQTKTLLKKWRDGDVVARDQLFDLLYIELRKVSAVLLRNEGRVSLSTGDLVNEAVMRLIKLEQIDWQDKAHFMALSARMMRRVLIDHARQKDSNKRHHQRVTLHTQIDAAEKESIDLINLEQALNRLHAIDPKRAEIVEMRYFGGLSLKEIAEVLQMSISTVQRSWRVSRAWLRSSMTEPSLK